MMRNSEVLSRAFTVRFADLRRWDPPYFRGVSWQWPEAIIRPISAALVRRVDEVSPKIEKSQVPIIEKISFGGIVSIKDKVKRSSYKGRLFWANSGDLVYSKIRVKQGSLAIVPHELGPIAVSSEYPVFTVRTDVAEPEYLALVLRSKQFLRLLDGLAHGGSTKTRIHPGDFLRLQIPLPALCVQQRIVNQWETAQNRINEARVRAARIEDGIAHTVLVELGIPSRQEVSPPKVFALPSSELDRWSLSYLSRQVSGAMDVENSRYPVVQLSAIADISYGIAKSPSNRPGRHPRPYLRVANVQRGELDLTEIKLINVPDSELERYRLLVGDLLVCEGNSADLVGRPAIWKGEIADCVHQNHILRVRVDPEIALPHYVLEYMQTLPARSYFRARAKFTTNLASINSTDLGELPIPLPPLNVQRAIMAEVEKARGEATREREAAAQLAQESQAEIEDLIRGTRSIAA